MAREYGKVLMSAWTDREFCALSRQSQGTYFFLASQSDLNRAGVITMALNRWASRCGENDRDLILKDMGELARAAFIVVDEDQEEVLVRSYIRADEGWKSPNIMVAIANAARQISSETLRAVISDELSKINTSGLSVTINAKTGRSTQEFIESVISGAKKSLNQCEKNPSVMAWGTLSGRVTETLSNEAKSERVTGRVPRGSLTTTTTPTTTTTTTSTTTSTPAITVIGDNGFDAFWDVYDKKQGRKEAIAKYRVALKKRGVTADLLLVAASEYIYWQRAEHKHPEFTKLATTWLNGEHWNDERATPVRKLATTDQRVADGTALTQRYLDQEAAEEQNLAIGTGR